MKKKRNKEITVTEYMQRITNVFRHIEDTIGETCTNDLVFNLHSLFEIQLLLDDAPINQHWVTAHPITGLLYSITDWAHRSKIRYANIQGITRMIASHHCNQSVQHRKLLRGRKNVRIAYGCGNSQR
jgi:hypothetical protein